MPVTRMDLAREVAKETGFTQVQCDEVARILISLIIERVDHGEQVTFTGWGRFWGQPRAARRFKRPRTGDYVDLPAWTALRWLPTTPLLRKFTRA